MTEPSADPRPAAPTPEETRWASFVMNEQRHGRDVSAADRTQAGEIMRRARHASGRTGGGSKAKPKASPLVVAKAIKDIDAKVAEAQGINASREGDPVPPPEAPALPAPPDAPERDFREASARLLEQIDVDLGRFRQARDNAAKLILDYDARLDRLQRRHEAILDGLRALDEPEGEEAPHA